MQTYTIEHYRGCTADYPEKPTDESPQFIEEIDLGDGEFVLQCSDCGAYIRVSLDDRVELTNDLPWKLVLWVCWGLTCVGLRFLFPLEVWPKALTYTWAISGFFYLAWRLTRER